jgi:hypothetical protein
MNTVVMELDRVRTAIESFMKARAYACYCTEDVDQTATTQGVCSPSSSQKQRNDLERPRV